MTRKEDDFDRKLNAALASLPQPRPSAAFSGTVLAAFSRERRAAALPAWPFAAAAAASSLAVAAAAVRVSFSTPRAAAALADGLAVLDLAARMAARFLPAPRAGAELSAAALLAAALFLTISMPHAPKIRLIGAKS